MAYIPGRMIKDNIRALVKTLEISSASDIDAVLVALDAKKAFDSVSHDYIRRCLENVGL